MASNVTTHSKTYDWEQEAAYGNQRPSSSDHHTTVLWVTFGEAVERKLRELKLIAQSTTECRNRPMIDPCNVMSGLYEIAQGLASFGLCFLSCVCFLSVF